MSTVHDEDHSISSSQFDEMDESNSTIPVPSESSTDEKPFPFLGLLCYADAVDWLLMALGTVGSIIHGMAFPVGYLLLGKALDAYGTNINDQEGMVHALYKVVPFVWYMAAATLPAGMVEISCWIYSSERQLARMRLAFLRSVLNQEVGAFDTDLTTAKIITGVTNHMSVIQDAIGEKLGHFVASFSTFFAGIIIAFASCWEVALLSFLVIPLILVIGATYTKQMNGISLSRNAIVSEATSIVEQTLSHIKTVFSFVGEKRAMRSFVRCMDNQYKLSKKEAVIKGIGLGLFQAVTFCSWALMVWIGAVAVTSRKATGGGTIAAIMSILFGAISITYAAPDLQTFNQAKAAGKEVFKVIKRKPSISYEKHGSVLGKVHGEIKFRRVHFAYPSRQDKPILQGFSLSIPAGKVVALVGSSGCGKSTVISLLQRFYDPTSGSILIDGHSIKKLDLESLRRNIASVSQEPSLFSGTIKDNLRIGKMDANDDEITKAARTANVHSFISKLPNEYLTEVGERGVQLSGGQKQRIAIARAMLKDPPILLLDEATSALDSESEKLVQDALEKAMSGRTVILIAHRMSTIVNADTIVVVENGKVAQTGTHQELIEKSTFYSNVCSMQNIEKEAGTRVASSSDNVIEDEIDEVYDRQLSPKQGQQNKLEQLNSKQPKQEKDDIAKILLGSSSAAISGISKPLFGYFIMTIGVAYYDLDAKRKVSKYSLIFFTAGVITLATVLRNELGWFEKPKNGVGFLTSRIVSDTSTVKTIISDRMAVIVQCISSILIATVVSMYVNWRMGLVSWAVMPCHFIGGLIQAKAAKGFYGDSAIAHQELVSLASEAASNIRTVASFVYEDEIIKKAELSLQEPMRVTKIESMKYGVVQGISLCLWNIAHAVALWYTTVLVQRKQASFENSIRSYQIFSLTVPSITELWTLIPMVMSAIAVLNPAFEMLDRDTQIVPDRPENPSDGWLMGRTEFQDVSFNYPSRPEVTILDGFSLVIEPSQRVALVGPSGAGKSSVLALLLRFYDPQRGRVLIDNKNIKDYNLRWLRKQIGLVQQEPILFNSSIRDNISYGSEETSETEIIQAAMEANIHEFISSLPKGYDTVVGEKGSQLSGGQKQRIAIARTLLKRPAILLLDEATSALDGESERVVMSSLGAKDWKDRNEGSSKITSITVAHRLSTVINSDTIVVMERGKVVELGNHHTLITADDGVYSRLVDDEEITSPPVEEKAAAAADKKFPFFGLLCYADGLDWLLMVAGTMGSFLHGMGPSMSYYLVGKGIDVVGNNIGNREATVHELSKLIPYMWALAIITLPGGMIEITCWMYTSQRQMSRMRMAYLRSVLSQDIGAFDTDLTTANVMAGATNHMSAIQDAIGEKVGMLSMLVVPMLLMVGATYAKMMIDASMKRIALVSAATTVVEQTLSHIKTVFSFVGENSAIKSFTKCMDKQYKLSKIEAMTKGLVWVGAAAVVDRSAKGGETIAAVINILSAAIYISNAAPDLQSFSQAKAAGKEVFEVINRNPAISYESNGTILEKVTGNIEIREVDFMYPSRVDKPILRSFSLSIPAGKVVALVGSSGCGKSTVISLVQRFYDPISGNILIDGQNIKELDLKSLRRSIGSVSQEPSLFSGTIMDNLRIGKMDGTDEEIIEIAKSANVHSFVSKLPNQYSTEVGERGVQLSGGQKQRIAIARAMLKDPPILLLDEATSALDSESEKLVQEALDGAMKGRTVILIAHRMSTIINSDKIVVVENGKVAQSGTHEELLEKSPFYSSVCSMQNLEKESGKSEERFTDQVREEQDNGSGTSNEPSSTAHEQEKSLELNPNQPKQDIRNRASAFYRIFLGTFMLEPGKILLGSTAAAISGVSKPIFAFYIMTVAIAYFDPDAKRIVANNIFQHYIYGLVGERAMNNLREALFSVILQNEIGWFEQPKNSVGFLTSRVVGDTSMIKTIISDRMSVIVQCISSILIATGLSIGVNWRMGLVAWALMPCQFIAGLVQVRSAKGFATDTSTSHRKLISLTSEAVSNIRTVASFGQEEEILKKADLSLQEPMQTSRIESIKYGVVQGVSLCLWHMTHAIALSYTIVLLDKSLATFENCVRAYQAIALTITSITELWSLIPMVISAIAILDPALDILDRETQIVPDEPKVHCEDRITGNIEFQDVSFSYPSRQDVIILDGFSLAIEPGQRVALVGPSGAGKSTIVSLLLRFYDPCRGQVLVDGKDVREYNLRFLRKQIGLVQQEPILFNLSIRENISYGNEGASETEIVEAAMEANIHEFISGLSNGYDTVVGDKGSQLSGGQKQRIAIARTILKRPVILLLDEATSALDGETEKVVMSSLAAKEWKSKEGELSNKITSITIAHRLSTVTSADVIVVMDKGEVVEMGSHETLVTTSNGVYSRLYCMQSKGMKD
uniref:MDR-like ABC transporter n=1 Tax=Oryza rufipogon TaxID=4529 RepID=A0A0E0QEF7_ORYRU